MRRFAVIAPGCAGEDTSVWEDAGFKLVDAPVRYDPELRTDVILSNADQASDIPWPLLRALLPKLFVLTGGDGYIAVIPGDLSEVFTLQFISGDNICFTLGSAIQGRVAAPDWEAYRESDGPLTRQEQIKALAGSIYRFLLEDAIRETAEWCGHMSSVVGPM